MSETPIEVDNTPEIIRTLENLFSCEDIYTYDVVSHYVKALQEVDSPESLERFTDYWSDLYIFPHRDDGIIDLDLLAVATGMYNKEEAWTCIQANRVAGCTHCQDGEEVVCAGGNILLPPILLYTTMVSKKYVVPTGAALVQLLRAYKYTPSDDETEIHGKGPAEGQNLEG